jgi:hypothetical protein
MPLSESRDTYNMGILFAVQRFQIHKLIITENDAEIPLTRNAKYSHLQPLHDRSGTSVV